MCRLVGWFGQRRRTLRDVLGDDGAARFSDLSAVHSNGWGISYLDPASGQPTAIRSTLPACEDPRFADLASNLAVAAATVHLRWATPGLGHTIEDTHPFVRDGWSLIHNGAIWPTEELAALRRPDSMRRPVGTTDSERLLLAILDELDASDGDIVAALETISDRAVRAGLRASSLNLMLLGASGMHILNWHDVAAVPAVFDADDPTLPPYYDLRHRVVDGTHVAASSGFAGDPASWQLLPNASLFSIGADGTRQLRDVRPDLPLCPVPDVPGMLTLAS
jgi:predicted glutamine amidotransferase